MSMWDMMIDYTSRKKGESISLDKTQATPVAERVKDETDHCAYEAHILLVATNLDSWEADDVRFGQEVMLDVCYRQLDAPYYAFLRHLMNRAKEQYESGKMNPQTYDGLRQRFNAIHIWVIEHIGEDALRSAIQTVDVDSYLSPSDHTFEAYRKTLDDSRESRHQVATESSQITKWDCILATRGYLGIRSAIIDDIVVIVRDAAIAIPDAWSRKVCFSLNELGLMIGSSRELVKQVCDVKQAFGGNVVPSDCYPFPEQQKSVFAA